MGKGGKFREDLAWRGNPENNKNKNKQNFPLIHNDRGNPMDLARRKLPTDGSIIQLEEEASLHNPLTFDPRNPRSFQKDFSKPGPFKVSSSKCRYFLNFIFSLVTLLSLSLSQVATTNITTTDHNGLMFSASIYYPSTEEGIGTPINLDGAPYPAIVFAHGWFQVGYFS